MRRHAALALSALVLAGCSQGGGSTSGFTGQDKAVAQVIADLVDAGQRGEAAEICERLLARELSEQVAEAGSSCPQEMEKAIEDADGFGLEVQRDGVRITGERATARVRSTDRGKSVVRTFELVRQDGDWRIAGFG